MPSSPKLVRKNLDKTKVGSSNKDVVELLASPDNTKKILHYLEHNAGHYRKPLVFLNVENPEVEERKFKEILP